MDAPTSPRLLPQTVDAPMRDAAMVAHHLQPMLSGLEHELLIALFLDGTDRLVGEVTIAGTSDRIILCMRRIFREALAVDARAMILAHNHPAGDSTPSTADISATRDCARVGRLLSVPVIDHLVFGSDNVASFRGIGLL